MDPEVSAPCPEFWRSRVSGEDTAKDTTGTPRCRETETTYSGGSCPHGAGDPTAVFSELSGRANKGYVGKSFEEEVQMVGEGVLEGKQVTVNSGAFRLKQKGAIYVSEPVVVDGNIITANGLHSTEEFAREIITALSNM